MKARTEGVVDEAVRGDSEAKPEVIAGGLHNTAPEE